MGGAVGRVVCADDAAPEPGGRREPIHRQDVPNAHQPEGHGLGEPRHDPVRHTWAEVLGRRGASPRGGSRRGPRRRRLAGGRSRSPDSPGAVDARGEPAMLHQPTPRTDLVLWAQDTTNVIDAEGRPSSSPTRSWPPRRFLEEGAA